MIELKIIIKDDNGLTLDEISDILFCRQVSSDGLNGYVSGRISIVYAGFDDKRKYKEIVISVHDFPEYSI